MKKRRLSVKAVEPGQVWQLTDSRLRIDMVGKMLVHYRRYKMSPKGVPTSLVTIRELEEHLRRIKAVLVEE